MPDNQHFKLKAVAAGISLALAGPTIAQEGILEEIIVTAAKRAQDIQDVSAAVTALGSEQLRMGGIEDLSRLEHLVPGLRFGQSGSEARPALRGTRTNNVGSEAEQVVGIFEDGVYVPTSTQALGAYVDVNRVEVLRGPQGTLYGRNTFGGTINVVTNEPSFDKVSGKIEALYGDYDRVRLEGMVNVPLTDTLAVRFAALHDEHDGYIRNDNPTGFTKDLNDKDLQFFRATAKWQPTEDLDITLRFTTSDEGNSGNAIWGYQQIGGFRDGVYRPGHQYAPADASDSFDEGPWRVKRNLESNADLESESVTLNMAYDFSFATFRFIGNWTDFQGNQNYDSDYSDGGDPLNNGFTGWDSSQETWSVEAQLVSNGDGPLQWLLGAYYYEQEANWNWQEFDNGQKDVPHWDRQGDYLSDSEGYFANASYAVMDKLRVLGGIRFAKDSKQQRDPLDWSVWPPVPLEGQGDLGNWDKTLWKAGFEFDLLDDAMFYATASTGYRAGGINFRAANVPLTYAPEEVIAYEAGIKSKLMDGAMTLNISAYLNEYSDLQAQSFVIFNDVVSEFTENGGEIDTYGLEVELQWRPDDRWNISANVSLMDSEFGEYNISKVAGLGDAGGRQSLTDANRPLLSLEGWTPALAPDFTAGLQVSYDFPFMGGYLTPFAQTTYTSKYYAADINVTGTEQDSHTKSDFRLIWRSMDARWELQGYVLNVENEAVLNRVVVFNPGPAPDLASLQAHWNNPRTWGFSLSYYYE